MVNNKKPKPLITQVVEYFITGGVWFWSGYIIIASLDDPLVAHFGEGWGLFIANFLGNAVGITLNFLLSRYWVFEGNKKSDLKNTTWRYVVYTALNAFGLNFLILKLLKSIGIEPEIGQFIAAGFFTVWNYFWYKFWVFKAVEPKKGKKK
ncbi:MAG: GtrA family protein [Candidatus Saccharimonadales bacterium]